MAPGSSGGTRVSRGSWRPDGGEGTGRRGRKTSAFASKENGGPLPRHGPREEGAAATTTTRTATPVAEAARTVARAPPPCERPRFPVGRRSRPRRGGPDIGPRVSGSARDRLPASEGAIESQEPEEHPEPSGDHYQTNPSGRHSPSGTYWPSQRRLRQLACSRPRRTPGGRSYTVNRQQERGKGTSSGPTGCPPCIYKTSEPPPTTQNKQKTPPGLKKKHQGASFPPAWCTFAPFKQKSRQRSPRVTVQP